ncbi:hypothetical protein BJ166DRAFT_501222 [Pestalotiopsis sp. NC0098]|nr:hypothetical protein BJ166DRAFT_501222 [Pestalotiopsis sp. NC0098]
MADLGGADITKYRERQLLDTEYIRNPSVLQLDEDDEYDSDSDDGVVYSHGRAPDLIDEHNDFFFLEKLPGRPGRLYRLREPELLETLLPTSRAVYERQRVSAHAVRTWFMNPNTTRQFLNREVDMEATPLHALVAATGPFPSKEDHLCKICRETHLAKSLAAKLTCGHQFDAECLSGWFRANLSYLSLGQQTKAFRSLGSKGKPTSSTGDIFHAYLCLRLNLQAKTIATSDEDSAISRRSSIIYRPGSCVSVRHCPNRRAKTITSPDEGESISYEAAPVINRLGSCVSVGRCAGRRAKTITSSDEGQSVSHEAPVIC